MIELPRQLAAWAPQLALFPEEMALALGATVTRLSSLIGGGQLAPAVEGEPDGYDGIARQGSYERLLPSEWLLLEEAPEEFTRRVVSGEHSFLRRAHTGGASGRRSVVLFDSGVEQLGGPRIGQLALLIVLARRAEQQGAALEWGVFQDPEGQLYGTVTKATVSKLIEARSARCVSARDFERWSGALRGSRASELWFVGSGAVEGAALRERARWVTLADVIEPGPQRLQVRASVSPASRPREVVLELPPERLAVQLLRDPFATAVAPRLDVAAALDVDSNLVLLPEARRLYARGTASSLVCFHVPNSPRERPKAPVALELPEGHTILAIGRSLGSKRTLVLSQHGTVSFVHHLSKRGATIAHSERFVPAHGYLPPERTLAGLRPLGVLERDHLCLIDGRGDLIELSNGVVSLKEPGLALAAVALHGCFAWVCTNHGVPRIRWAMSMGNGEMRISDALVPSELPPIASAYGFYFGAGLSALFAYATSATSWVIVHDRRCISIQVAPERRVMGVIERRHEPSEVGLVALDTSATQLELLLPQRSETLTTTAAPITSAEVSGSRKEIAFLTRSGEVGVYSCRANAIVMRSRSRAES